MIILSPSVTSVVSYVVLAPRFLVKIREGARHGKDPAGTGRRKAFVEVQTKERYYQPEKEDQRWEG